MKRKFWNWVRNEGQDAFGSERTLYLDGEISDETWFGDEITPKQFKEELDAGSGPITLWINSPGGDVFAAAQIYNMLMDYKGDVMVKIDALAASAASVIAMAGTRVCMSPVAMLMIHNPATIAIGDAEEMQKAIDMLSEVKESIMNAYEIKTGLSRQDTGPGCHWSYEPVPRLPFCAPALLTRTAYPSVRGMPWCRISRLKGTAGRYRPSSNPKRGRTRRFPTSARVWMLYRMYGSSLSQA